MSYAHIGSLYKDQEILLFKECYALEKIHGTSAHISYKEGKLNFFSGLQHENFKKLFNEETLLELFAKLGHPGMVVFGEAYGGKVMGMSETYGTELRFIVFDVKCGDCWLSVPDMADVAKNLGLCHVYFERIPATLSAIEAQRDAFSVEARLRGMGDKPREGVVLRPPLEVRMNNGERVCAKHKQEDFSERVTKQKVLDPEKLIVLTKAREISDEWVTAMRLQHVLQKFPETVNMEQTREVILAMIEDVYREGKGEIVESPDVNKAIGRKTAGLFKQYFKQKLECIKEPAS